MSQPTSSAVLCVSRARIAFLPPLSRQIFPILSALLILWGCPASAQLSQNSGINASDTYAIFDISFQGKQLLILIKRSTIPPRAQQAAY